MKEEGLAVPTIRAALEDKNEFEYLLAEAERIARENPEDARSMMEALDNAEKFLDIGSGAAAKEWLGTFAGGTVAMVALAAVLSLVFQMPVPIMPEASAAVATVDAWDKHAARKRLLRVRETLAGALETA